MMPDPLDPRPRWGEVGIHGIHRLREWDAVVTAEAAGLDGDELELVLLEGDDHPFARALEGSLEPPYRVRGVRRGPDSWTVAARHVSVEPLPGVSGEELLLTVQEGEASLEVDGMPTIAGLDRLLEQVPVEHSSYVLRAGRVRDELWELAVDPL
jgi:hypothetical protein